MSEPNEQIRFALGHCVIDHLNTLLNTFLSSDQNKSQSNLPGQMDPLLDTDRWGI